MDLSSVSGIDLTKDMTVASSNEDVAEAFLATLLFAETAVSGICYGQEAEAFSNAEEV